MATATLSTRPHSLTHTLDLAGPVALLGRLFFAAIFLMAGFSHFSTPAIAYAASQGVPLASLAVPLSGVIALLGGLSILLGYRARQGAWIDAVGLSGLGADLLEGLAIKGASLLGRNVCPGSCPGGRDGRRHQPRLRAVV